jgi:predicted esterase
MPTVHTIPVTTHGRFLVRESQGPPVGLLVGFHGYAQDAEALLGDIDPIEGSQHWLVVSVQGLHRFYARGGELVVASWMTSQDRDVAIADNIAYVRTVVENVRSDGGATGTRRNLPVVFAGFSQGAAMAYRAAMHVTPTAGIIALAGDVPPDVRDARPRLPPVLVGRGSKDTWYSAEKLERDKTWFGTAGIDATISIFEGGHEFTDAFRADASRFLARVGRRVGQVGQVGQVGFDKT